MAEICFIIQHDNDSKSHLQFVLVFMITHWYAGKSGRIADIHLEEFVDIKDVERCFHLLKETNAKAKEGDNIEVNLDFMVLIYILCVLMNKILVSDQDEELMMVFLNELAKDKNKPQLPFELLRNVLIQWNTQKMEKIEKEAAPYYNMEALKERLAQFEV